MIRTFARTAGIALLAVALSGHVGSPDTWFEGNAGPYRVTVQIETAGVVPGVANVFVRVVGDRADNVTIQANRFDATGAVPPPEPTARVSGEDGLFAGKLWMMTGGSNSVTVDVSGPKGNGKVVVPVVIIAYSRLQMDVPMGIGLAAMGVFLFAGLVTIIGAAVREASLPPGEPPTPKTRRRARNAMAITTAVLAISLLGGWKWWRSEDDAYVRNMYRPLSANAAIENTGTQRLLKVSIADSAWIHRGDTAWLRTHDANSWTPLVEDHGKLMHLFAVREDMNAFVHLHPPTRDTVEFPAVLPPVPPGRYRVFADIVHESGFTHTMVSSVEVPPGNDGPAALPTDVDDSWFAGPVAKAGSRATLEDGTLVEWKPDHLVAGRPGALAFTFTNSDGTPATLEPYMGMPGHAVVQRSDGSVFVHLHPMGTISMASQMAFEMRQPGDTIRGLLGKRISEAERAGMTHNMVHSNVVSFPYAFPRAGDYRVWVQVKRSGKVMTAAFDARVSEAGA